MAATGVLHEPFAVINADDFYGAASFKTLADYLKQSHDTPTVADYSMVGFVLRNTLSEHGTVSRAICERDAGGFLTNIVERTKIEKTGNAARYLDEAGQAHPLTGDELVSMNMFGFTPSAFELLRAEFVKFLSARINDEKAEFFIPTPMNALIKAGRARMKVLSSTSAWFGITYREDKPLVVENIRRLVQQGVYPERLWT